MLSRGTVEALFRSVLQTGKDETLQTAVDHIMRSLSEPAEQGETPRTEQEASLLAAIDGNYAGMSHADLVHTAKMLHKGRQLWRERAETAERRVSELEAKLAESSRDAERQLDIRRFGWKKLMGARYSDGRALACILEEDREYDAALAAERKESGNG